MSYQAYGDIYPPKSRDKYRLGTSASEIYTCTMLTFRDALLNTLEENEISLKALAEGAGVSYEQLKKLKQNKSRSTNVDDAAKIADYLGMSLTDLLSGAIGPSHAEITSVLQQLTPEDRRFLLNAAKAQIAHSD